MAKKRPGDPWLAEYEEEIILRCLHEMEAKYNKPRPVLVAHPKLGVMFSRLEPRTPRLPRHFTAWNLIEEYPMRFAITWYSQGRWSTMPAQQRPGTPLLRALKRMAALGPRRALREAHGRSPKQYRLLEASGEARS